MAERTAIEWTDSTFNGWIGCTKVSTEESGGGGCDNCYAEIATPSRTMKIIWGVGQPRHRTSPQAWHQPILWNAQLFCECATCGWRGERRETALQQDDAAGASRDACPRCRGQHLAPARRRVFGFSLGDWADKEAIDEWRADLAALILATPNLDWLLLTKRIGIAGAMLAKMFPAGIPDNVLVGATMVNQHELVRDLPKLLRIRARRLFVSLEPLLGAITFADIYVQNGILRQQVPALGKLCQVIVGGESGHEARPMHPDWPAAIARECAEAGVPFMFKQWGSWLPICEHAESFTNGLYRSNRKAMPHEDQGAIDELYGRTCTVPYEVIHRDGSRHQPLEPNAFIAGAMTTFKVGKKAAGRTLNGNIYNGFPS